MFGKPKIRSTGWTRLDVKIQPLMTQPRSKAGSNEIIQGHGRTVCSEVGANSL